MLSKKHLLFALFFLLLGSLPILAQDSDGGGDNANNDEYNYPGFRTEEYKEFVNKGKHDQQDKFLDYAYPFPARPKDKIQLGLNVGLLMISGDVKARPGLGFGVSLRKSLGYLFSLRAGFMMGSTTGQNWEPTRGWSISSRGDGLPNKALGGAEYYDTRTNGDFDYAPDYFDETNPNENARGALVYYNYKTRIRELTLSGILTLHNIRFHKRQSKLELYGLAGIGGTAYRAMMNQLDGNGNIYDYSSVYNSNDLVYDDRSSALDALNSLMDDTYESQAERHFDDFTPFDNYSFKPTAHVGIGVAFKLNNTFNLALESKVTYTNDDLLDGQRWQEWGALTRDYDTYVYTGAQLNVNLGGKNSVEPLWWMNPLDYAYGELAAAPCCDDLPPLPDLKDDDNDGVPNAWDEEPDSKEGCPVDTKGRVLDSDRDGVLDCDDKEPHTRYDAIENVDEFGIAPEMRFKCDQVDDFCKCLGGCDLPADTIYKEITRVDTVYNEITKTTVDTIVQVNEIVRIDTIVMEVEGTPPPPPEYPKCIPGGRCNDENPDTENDYYDENCNCVGTVVPKCAAAGTSCNDNNPSTINDQEDGNCNCVGTPCAAAGTPCDDGNPETENDKEDGQCNCMGTKPACPEAGSPCDDGNPATTNDKADGNCGCKGTIPCPAQGSPCDDGNPRTIGDKADGNCGCRGYVPAPPPPPPPRVVVTNNCCNQVLPRILFGLNKYSVRPEFKAQLGEVAKFLNSASCSNERLAVIGHTDARAGDAYNDVLSYKRDQEVVDLLVREFGIPRNRLVIQHRGEMDPTIGGLSDSPGMKNIDADHALNRRVEFRCASYDAVDMPMPDGPANAGTRKPKPQPQP